MQLLPLILSVLLFAAHRVWEQPVFQQLPPKVIVLMQTEVGTIELAVDTVRAPITATNFLKYVDGKFFDGGRFFRTVTMDNQPNDSIRIEVVQGDVNPDRKKEVFPPIELERTSKTGLRHLDGVVSMARAGPNTATSSIFICINDQPQLDYGGKRNPDGQGFAAFAKVVKGMDVVRKIHNSPAEGQSLKPPVSILSVRRK